MIKAFLLRLPAIVALLPGMTLATMLDEDFQHDLSPSWKLVSKGIQIVAEDEAKPDGNRVARFTAPGQWLAGPHLRPGDWQSAIQLGDELDDWQDYKLTFRFRAGNIPDVPAQVRGRGVLFRVLWRVNPAEDNPNESYDLEFRWNRHNGDWELMGPRVHWAGAATRPEAVDELGPAGGKADNAWHTIEISVQGDTITTMFDGDFHMRVRDTRIGQGTIAFQSAWSPDIDPGFVEIDDIHVEAIGTGNATALSPNERLLQNLARGCLFAYLPSRNSLHATFDFSRSRVYDRKAVAMGSTFTGAHLRLLDKDRHTLAEARLSLSEGVGPEVQLELPPLQGEYRVAFTLESPEGPLTIEKPLLRQSFPWEGNTLGISDQIYPPFTPVAVDHLAVDVVQRRHAMNAFGLWDSIVSQGRELLAAPITVRARMAGGEAAWRNGDIKLLKQTAAAARFASTIASDPVIIEAHSTIEFDGCMKVEMTLAPGPRPQQVERLWIDIPLRDLEAPLLHTYVDGMRINHAGATPAGEGSIWQSAMARRRDEWRNSFCSYLWLGAEERGLAWFAENDRGWLTARDGGNAPLQELIREGDRLTLRVYLVNTPSTITTRHHLVFGLQASPTKPMPDDWRLRGDYMPPISGPVSPWGGLSCSYKGPYRGDWTIVDRIAAAHKSGKLDEEWLAAYVAAHDPPPVQGTNPWADSVRKFVDKWAIPRRTRPAMVYSEEMAACTLQPEWWTFQDEWTMLNAYTQREQRTDDAFRKGPTPSSARSAFPPSYQEYALWYHNEWLKRGISLYWDNCHPIASSNPRTSAAYVTESGAIQPALVIWNQRDYMKRTWNLLQYWKRHQPDEVEWSVHRTNTQLLPLHGWATISLDLEWSARYTQPFPADEIRTTVMGRQTGVYGADHRSLFGKTNPVMLAYADTHPEWPGRASWGMRMVHELARRSVVTPGFGPEASEAAVALDNLVVNFGYGDDEVAVHNYWADSPAVSISHDEVKWLALSRNDGAEALIVLASWSPEALSVELTLHNALKGATTVTDAETGATIASTPGPTFAIALPPAYGVRVLNLKQIP